MPLPNHCTELGTKDENKDCLPDHDLVHADLKTWESCLIFVFLHVGRADRDP